MPTGYTRQSSAQIVNGLIINDSDFNNEFNLLQTFASGVAGTGHDHSGGTGLGPLINLTATVPGVKGVLDAQFGGIHSAAADPTVSNDNTQGYVVGCIWFNTATTQMFRCSDTTTGAAVWVRQNGQSTASDPTTTSDKAHNYIIGSFWYNTSTKALLLCVDNTNGAAVWVRLNTPTITGASTIPVVGNDNTQWYVVGSLIYNSTQNEFYICTSAATGAATWLPQGSGRVYSAAGAPGASNDNIQGYVIGSIGVDTTAVKGYVCTSAATGAATWALITASIFGLTFSASKVAGFTAVAGTMYPCDVTGGGFTVTFPASATAPTDVIGLVLSGNNALTLAPNGLNINGSSNNYVLTGEQTIFLTYGTVARGWV